MALTEPSRAWAAQPLVGPVAVSRATLVLRSSDVVGVAPSGYLHQWRMNLTSQRPRGTGDPAENVARAVGYTSVAAFTRAFTRARSRSPGSFRQAFAEVANRSA
ncbi:helix-turn-helix domain-containing protein [Streptomyces sp. NPDC093149]|uniref:helix-turn-helix domain-containing protein n=1 Tax=Streptomyces sp. NPDC093149 TaxID=3366031 RepID=UPI0037F660B9